MNRVLITGRLTRDPELRTLAGGKTVTQFSVATNDYRAGEERSEYHSVVTWVRRPLGRTRAAFRAPAGASGGTAWWKIAGVVAAILYGLATTVLLLRRRTRVPQGIVE